jgi:hypothetical protein
MAVGWLAATKKDGVAKVYHLGNAILELRIAQKLTTKSNRMTFD